MRRTGTELGERLRRSFGDNTQTEVADYLGVSKQYLGAILLGRRNLTVPLAVKMAKRWKIDARAILLQQLTQRLDEQIARVKP